MWIVTTTDGERWTSEGRTTRYNNRSLHHWPHVSKKWKRMNINPWLLMFFYFPTEPIITMQNEKLYIQRSWNFISIDCNFIFKKSTFMLPYNCFYCQWLVSFLFLQRPVEEYLHSPLKGTILNHFWKIHFGIHCNWYTTTYKIHEQDR